MLLNYLIVGLGGALGAMARHGVGSFVAKAIGDGFPWGTFLINIAGSFAIGALTGAMAFFGQWTQEVRLFTTVGVLGGFTTFSAFSLETILLFERGQVLPASIYVVGSVALSIFAAVLGLYLLRIVSS